MRIHHLNCGVLHAPPNPSASCHCLLLEQEDRLVLVDTGIGLEDVRQPVERIGAPAIQAAGFQFHESLTARRQLEQRGLKADAVTDVVLTHADPDHTGGLADFPEAKVHLSAEELACVGSGLARYAPAQFAHGVRWNSHATHTDQWFGLESRPLGLFEESAIALIPLFGHTRGHCGVAIEQEGRWLLHVGDAYYLRGELDNENHPVSALASLAADNDNQRRHSLDELRRLARDHADAIDMIGYHDFTEFPSGVKLEA